MNHPEERVGGVGFNNACSNCCVLFFIFLLEWQRRKATSTRGWETARWEPHKLLLLLHLQYLDHFLYMYSLAILN